MWTAGARSRLIFAPGFALVGVLWTTCLLSSPCLASQLPPSQSPGSGPSPWLDGMQAQPSPDQLRAFPCGMVERGTFDLNMAGQALRKRIDWSSPSSLSRPRSASPWDVGRATKRFRTDHSAPRVGITPRIVPGAAGAAASPSAPPPCPANDPAHSSGLGQTGRAGQAPAIRGIVGAPTAPISIQGSAIRHAKLVLTVAVEPAAMGGSSTIVALFVSFGSRSIRQPSTNSRWARSSRLHC